MKVSYKPSFIRKFKKLPKELQQEILDKTELFKDKKNHEKLRVHTLSGKLKGFNSFSVNYQYRIIFDKQRDDTILFLIIGTHDVYK